MAQEQTAIRERQKTRLKEPRRYVVMMFNDDFTPMDFVVDILQSIFFKSAEEAETIMLKVHHEEKAVVGTYSYEPTLKSKACLKCLYFTIIIFDLCRYLEYFSYLYTINQTE